MLCPMLPERLAVTSIGVCCMHSMAVGVTTCCSHMQALSEQTHRASTPLPEMNGCHSSVHRALGEPFGNSVVHDVCPTSRGRPICCCAAIRNPPPALGPCLPGRSASTTAMTRQQRRTARVSHVLRSLRELSPVQGVKLYTQNALTHGRFCCDPSCFEAASIPKLLPHAVPRLALPLDGR